MGVFCYSNAMELLKNRKPIILATSLLALTITALLFFVMGYLARAPEGMRQVEGFDANGICLAINNPECGYCPNKLIDGKCFVKKGELEQYQ